MTSRLGTGKWISFFTVYCFFQHNVVPYLISFHAFTIIFYNNRIQGRMSCVPCGGNCRACRWQQQEQQLLPCLLIRLWQLLFRYGMCLHVAAAGAAAIAMPSDTTVATPVQVCVYRRQQQEQLFPCLLIHQRQLV